MRTLTQVELGVDNTQVTHISLCAGYGGIDIGLSRAIPNLRTIAFSEIEAYAAANLVSKMEAGLLDSAPIWTNLKTFPWQEFHGKVDIISGGFPCQPFSAAGKRNADTDERHLFPYILEGIRQCRPSIVFLENVEGIISAKLSGDNWSDPAGTPVLLHVLRELERVGYKATAGVFSASEVGAPHQRKRVFILGYSEHYGLPTLKKLRGYETTGNNRGQEKQRETGQLERTSRPINVSGLSGCQDRSELGNTKGERSERLRTSWFTESHPSSQEGLSISSSEAVSNTNNNGGGEVRSVCQGADGTKSISYGESWGTPYPSRPGQPQYEWEPPRVVGNTNNDGLKQRRRHDCISQDAIRGDSQSQWSGDTKDINGQSAYGNTPSQSRDGNGVSKPTNAQENKASSSTRLCEMDKANQCKRLSRQNKPPTNKSGTLVSEGQQGLRTSINRGLGDNQDTLKRLGEVGQSDDLSGINRLAGRIGEEVGNTNSRRLEGTSEIKGRTNDVVRSSGEAMENTDSTRGRSKDRDSLHKGRATCEDRRESISQDTQRGDGVAVADNQSTSGDGITTTSINEIESEMGRDSHGPTSGMGYGELCETVESRVDELRLLGNGVVPDTAHKAFVVLSHRLFND